MVDWGAGSYETTAGPDLVPAAHEVVQRARLSGGEDVLDLACGSGNAAIVAATTGARVTAVDGAERLLGVARARAAEAGVDIDFRHGDLHALPVQDDSADVVLSVMGVVFASEPPRALAEIARVLRPGGRALVTAWVPSGPIDAMLTALRGVVSRVVPTPPPASFAWADPAALEGLAGAAGLRLEASEARALEIRAASPEAYLDHQSQHPMAVSLAPLVEQAGLQEELRAAMLGPLRDANEQPGAFLIHSPYVIHVLAG